jgi:hypothetical protein
MQRGPTIPSLPIDHPTAVAFLDETGSISQDRFFSVGCLILPEPSLLLRRIQKLRDVHHWYTEMKWVELTQTSYPLYRAVLEEVSRSDSRYACFVADRQSADPVSRFGDPWRAYEKLSAQLLIGAARPGEIITVLADNYSTPDNVVFEVDVRREVNSASASSYSRASAASIRAAVTACSSSTCSREQQRSSTGRQPDWPGARPSRRSWRQTCARSTASRALWAAPGTPDSTWRRTDTRTPLGRSRRPVDTGAIVTLAGEGLRPLARFSCPHNRPEAASA